MLDEIGNCKMCLKLQAPIGAILNAATLSAFFSSEWDSSV